MLTKDFSFDIKALDEKGQFEGFASVYGNVDSYGDIVMPGAFARTILEKGGEVVILNQHDQRDPIGLGKLEDSATGLRITGSLNLDLRCAVEAYSNLKKRILKGLSIGYQVLRDEYDRQTNHRKLLDLELYEVSLVTFPANARAVVTGVKSGNDLLDAVYAEIKAGRRFSMASVEALRAICDALRDQIEMLVSTDTDAAKALPSTIRDFEARLRDVGFSRKDAAALASHGWKALQRDSGESNEAALIAHIERFQSQIRSSL